MLPFVEYYENGKLWRKSWKENGKLHREKICLLKFSTTKMGKF